MDMLSVSFLTSLGDAIAQVTQISGSYFQYYNSKRDDAILKKKSDNIWTKSPSLLYLLKRITRGLVHIMSRLHIKIDNSCCIGYCNRI